MAAPTPQPAAPRVVSLVPSDTYSIVAMGGRSHLVGRTRYCVQPPDMDDVPIVGGAKDVDIDHVIAIAPDVVFANREENSKSDVERLQQAGLFVEVTFPKHVRETASHLRNLAHHAGLLASPESQRVLTNATSLDCDLSPEHTLSCWLPIWRSPWMTVTRDTHLDSVLSCLGLRNIFADLPTTDEAGRDTRYPVVSREQVEQRAPQVIILPDEPYRFSRRHIEELLSWNTPASNARAIVVVDGQDMCWHGAWFLEALPRLRNVVQALRRRWS